MNGENCFICRHTCKCIKVQDRLADRLEELCLIFGVHEALKRRLKQTISTTRRNYESENSSAEDSCSVVSGDVADTPAVAVDIAEFIERLDFEEKKLQQALLVKSTILDNLKEHSAIASTELHYNRVAEVLKIFRVIPIEASRNLVSKTSKGLVLNGCSTIAGFPIQNDGNYDASPIDAVSAALMNVSRLLNALSAALNIPLPHPLSPYSDSGAESMVAPQFDLNAGFYLTPAFYMNDGSEYQLFSWVSTANLRSQNSMKESCSSGSAPAYKKEVEEENTGKDKEEDGSMGRRGSPRYVLNDQFEQALTLLRADVVFLCLQSGLPAAVLWPSEAILLNLDLLQRHMQRMLLPATEG